MSEDIFNVSQLLNEIMQHESMGLPARNAMRTFSTHIRLHSFSANRKTFTFKLLQSTKSADKASTVAYLTLQVIKGSLHTLIWSTFARFDDEYALFFHLDDTDIYNITRNVCLVWSVKGVDAVNSKISAGLIDWFVLRRIQAILKISSVGVLAFAKMLGRFLLSVPNYIKMRKYLPPMPATFMFNYLMVVCYCPFELSVPKLTRLLDLGTDGTTGFSMKRLLQTLIQPNGSGSWLLGYLPVRVAAGGYVLQSKYYFQQGDPPPPPSDSSPLLNTENASTAPPSVAAPHNAAYTTSISPAFNAGDAGGASSYSQQCARLMMETAVRVVEVLPHPLGRRELVAVLEFVHNNQWSANTRFVSLDVFKVGQAIQLAGQPPPQFLSKIDIMGKSEWEQRVQDHEAATTLISGATLLGDGIDTLHSVGSLTALSALQSPHLLVQSPLGSSLIDSLSAFSSPLPSNQQASALLQGLSSPAAGSDEVSGGRVVPTVSLDAHDTVDTTPITANTMYGGDIMPRESHSVSGGGLSAHADAHSLRVAQSRSSTSLERSALMMTSDSDSSSDDPQADTSGHDSADFFIENIRTPSSHRSKKRKTSTPSADRHRLFDASITTGVTGGGASAGWKGSNNINGSNREKKKNYRDFIDFENSCEWGAPGLVKRHTNFYVDLIRELLQPTPGADSTASNDLNAT